ncbi:hypothetical protein IUD24_10870 [Xylella fastidiosa subsp. multiplex]|nr:hypothetical protein [Xylella fastidiosa]QPC00212.1 hypothetical protein IUD24_10870 [Xylella fastidiosa subsp. multiplex]UIT45649.1 hypothetical protein LZ751_10935 [Xylella fastidiosa subsp. multiplex]
MPRPAPIPIPIPIPIPPHPPDSDRLSDFSDIPIRQIPAFRLHLPPYRP